jgi:uncharacterized membrane protein
VTEVDWNSLANRLFDACVALLRDMAAVLGTTYEIINIVLFVLVQPALILLFLALWLRSERRVRRLRRRIEDAAPRVAQGRTAP